MACSSVCNRNLDSLIVALLYVRRHGNFRSMGFIFGLKYQAFPPLSSHSRHRISAVMLWTFSPQCHLPSMLSPDTWSQTALKCGGVVTLVGHELHISPHRFLANFMWLKTNQPTNKNIQTCPCFILQCSVSCGRGHKQRNVYCIAKDGSHLESDYCKHLAKPSGHRKCRGGRCPRWKAGAWSQVSNASPPPHASSPDPGQVAGALTLAWVGRERRDGRMWPEAGGFSPSALDGPPVGPLWGFAPSAVGVDGRAEWPLSTRPMAFLVPSTT